MKCPKRLLVVATFSLMPLLGFGQGTVNFVNAINLFTDGIDRLVYADVVGGTKLIGTNYLAQLYYGTDASSLVPVTSAPARFRGTTAIGTVLEGTWSGGTRTLDGFGAGAVVTLEVRVWDIAAGATYEDAAGVGFAGTLHGVSDVFTYLIHGPGGCPPTCGTMTGLRAFALVPEPSAIALAFLGVSGILLLRRRKKPDLT